MIVQEEANDSRINPEERKAIVARAWALREKAIEEGLELWDLERVDAELARERR